MIIAVASGLGAQGRGQALVEALPRYRTSSSSCSVLPDLSATCRPSGPKCIDS